ncbi:hypothetical protein TrVE_jg14439 [Triparma verrucosa]|uniref:Rab-GAP TBC domain-containing protein n=1 Tax=Triparma verrucosa TaxID=1606542 RepID=A0A9W7EZW7_9STRA|nr:hypothetical protein TrVE_jg14439 [Triparma verrucosa]
MTDSREDPWGWPISEFVGEGEQGENNGSPSREVAGSGEPKVAGVLRSLSPISLARFGGTDTVSASAWEAFVSARKSSENQIGDAGSEVWYKFLASSCDSAALSLVMRKGLPQCERRKVWLEWGVDERTSDESWKALMGDVDKVMGTGGEEKKEGMVDKDTLHTIEVDLLRTMPDHPYFSSSGGHGFAALKKILLAVALKAPEVGYLQGMNFLGAFMLLTFKFGRDEENDADLEKDVFDCLKSVTTTLLKGYYAPGLTQLLGDTEMLRQLVSKTDPELHLHLSEMGFDLTLVCPQWFVCNFVTSAKMDVVARIWDLLMFAGKGGRGESGGVMAWVGLAMLGAVREKLMETTSMCRVITEIRKFTMEGVKDVDSDLWKRAGLSVHSFFDAGRIREEVVKMGNGGKKRGWDGEGGGESDEPIRQRPSMLSRANSFGSSFATPMTKKRRTATENFARRNGISRDQPEGRFLFEPAEESKVGLVDKAESFFKFAAELMTPTPSKPKRKFGTSLSSKIRSGSILFGENNSFNNEEAKPSTKKFSKSVSFGAPPSPKEMVAMPPPPPSSESTFLSPNSKGFEMTPVKTKSRPSTGKKKKKQRTAGTPHPSQGIRQTHFFTSPEMSRGGGRAGFMSPEDKLIMSPLAEMR